MKAAGAPNHTKLNTAHHKGFAFMSTNVLAPVVFSTDKVKRASSAQYR